jgi:hypothetical protein
MKLPVRAFLATSLFIALAFAVTSAARATHQSTQAPAATTPSTTIPALISMCEDSDGCSDWGFNGSKGIGLWTDGANADLTITHLDAKTITVHRVDSKGTGAGIVADYSGMIAGNWIEGDVAVTWKGHQAGVTHTKWHGLIFPSQDAVRNTAKNYEASLKQATAWAVCSDFGNRCSDPHASPDLLLVMAGQSGAMRLIQDASAQIFIYVDETPDHTVAIRRFDKNGTVGGATLLYSGKRNGTKITGTFKAIWPGHGNTSTSGNFTATAAPDRCTPAMPAATATQTGMMANLLENKQNSFNCYSIAANQGDQDAEAILGLYYYVGWGTTVDFKNALHWLQKAGNQEDALMALSVMYQRGQGVPVDLLMSHYLADRVELAKRYRARYPNGQPPAFAADIVDKFGDLFSWVYGFKSSTSIKPLAAKVDHERGVVGYMQKGMSRVNAEKKYYSDLQAMRAQTHSECSSPDFSALQNDPKYPKGTSGYWAREFDEEDLDVSYGLCMIINPIPNAAFEQAMQGYLTCVNKNVDSNAIEKNCEFPMPRLGF